VWEEEEEEREEGEEKDLLWQQSSGERLPERRK